MRSSGCRYQSRYKKALLPSLNLNVVSQYKLQGILSRRKNDLFSTHQLIGFGFSTSYCVSALFSSPRGLSAARLCLSQGVVSCGMPKGPSPCSSSLATLKKPWLNAETILEERFYLEIRCTWQADRRSQARKSGLSDNLNHRCQQP